MIDKIKDLLGNIPRQTFLFYNKRELINVIINCYEQVKESVKTINEFIEKVNNGEFNGKDGEPGIPGEPGKPGEGIDHETLVEIQTGLTTANTNASNAITKVSSLETKVNTASSVANTAISIADRAITVAKGKATGYVFDTTEDMNLWLEDEDNISKLTLGDNFYIRDIDVPDYWWDGENIQQLETQKVDLSEYVKTNSINGLVKTTISSIEWYGSQAEYDALETKDNNIKYYIYKE